MTDEHPKDPFNDKANPKEWRRKPTSRPYKPIPVQKGLESNDNPKPKRFAYERRSDALVRRRSDIYHATVTKLKADNEYKQEQLKIWEADKKSKPPYKDFEKAIGGRVLSEQEISAKAAATADERIKQDIALQKSQSKPTKAKDKSMQERINVRPSIESKKDVRNVSIFKKRDNTSNQKKRLTKKFQSIVKSPPDKNHGHER